MNVFSWLLESKSVGTSKWGWVCFELGVLFLASSAFLSGVFCLIASISSCFYRIQPPWVDKWNYPLALISILMIVGCFNAYSGWLAWVGLANWIPFFFLFWAFQPYLLTSHSRKRVAILLVIGTIPVVITGFGQLWFGWNGPWQIFNGLVVWFVSPNGYPNGRLSGLFSYANIAGAWLALIWPFSLAGLLRSGLNFPLKVIALSITSGIAAALILTDSRNAWGGMFLAIPFVVGISSWFWLLPLLILFLTPLMMAVLPGIPVEMQLIARKLVPESFWMRLNDMQYLQARPLEATRLIQWKEALKLIFQKPWFGYGAAAFSVLYPLRQGLWHGHAHNLPLELSVAHGLPVAILVVMMVLTLLIFSFPQCFLSSRQSIDISFESSLFDRAWWSATLILVFLHGSDMPFFDSRINLLGWILLAGLRSLLLSKQLKTKNDSKHLCDV